MLTSATLHADLNLFTLVNHVAFNLNYRHAGHHDPLSRPGLFYNFDVCFCRCLQGFVLHSIYVQFRPLLLENMEPKRNHCSATHMKLRDFRFHMKIIQLNPFMGFIILHLIICNRLFRSSYKILKKFSYIGREF